MSQAKNIVITGGTGLVGKAISQALIQKGYVVKILTQQKSKADQKQYFFWDWKNQIIDPKAIENTHALIHLAGRNISQGRWSPKVKQELLESRVNSLDFLQREFQKTGAFPEILVSASGTGYYDHLHPATKKETSPPGHDFLAKICLAWEQAAQKFTSHVDKVVIIRTGVVISYQGGMLPLLNKLANLYLSQVMGHGKQIIPWISLDDLAQLYLQAIENKECQGAYNAVAGNVSQKELITILAELNQKPILLPAAPNFLMRLLLGEKSILLTQGSLVSNQKVLERGFLFKYPILKDLLKDNLL